jgi:hypothetical protein
MRIRRTLCVGALVLGLLPVKAPAHHAFAAEFEAHKPVTVTGTVSKVMWLNPHTRFYVDVKDPHGVIKWEFVLGSPNLLIRQGWTKDFLKNGEVITITGFQARDGSHLAAARTIRMPNGQVVTFGTAGDGGPEH